ncbi:glycosyltransferase family 2 protein [Balneola sp. MJW-20]|uniref:glycosyltransferase family 2 protein n=1 Tax=Gracilimonas aurantiaca TaxID=3234185 RepID=UPI0034672899
MIIIEIIQLVLLSLTGIFILYVFFLSVFALMAKKRKDFEADSQRKFAVVIPAHNEEIMISQTLYSAFSMIYPKNSYEIFVVADNCEDHTAEIAEKIGATVLERNHETDHGKGYALRWAFSKVIEMKKFDAIVVIDADTQISGNFLKVMNYYMEQGAKVIQSSDVVQPQPNVWSSEMTRIGFTLYNIVRPLGRSFLGLSMGLRGNGMCFDVNVLKETPWEAYSLTEDIEYGILLMLKGHHIKFAPEATVTAKMPEKAKNAESQRARWEIGRYPIMRRYSFPLIKAFFSKRSLSYLDTFIDLIMPPMVNLLLVICVFMGINTLLAVVGLTAFWPFALAWFSIFLIALAHLFIGFKAAKVDRNLYVALAHVPKYAIWKFLLYAKAIFKAKEDKWIRTSRESSSNVDQVV